MYDIITFGSATQDIRLKSKAFKVLKNEKDFVTGQGLCLTLGSKIEVEDIQFTSGGGGTNTAATFAKQGFKVAYCGSVGQDNAGKYIIAELKKLKVDTRFVLVKNEKHTNHSVIIFNDYNQSDANEKVETKERTILAYRGASELMDKNDIPWKKLKTKWIYLAPLTGLLCDTTEEIVNFAFQNKIKIAINPSKEQLSLPPETLKNILQKIDILFLNKEEASFLTKIPYEQENEIFKKLDQLCPGVAVMTKGGDGVVAADGKYFYSAIAHKDRRIIDTTGAGDSFASGFLTDFIKYNGDIEKAIQMGLANSEANLAEIGAKTGLLDRNIKFERVPVAKQLCSENNLCLPKN